MNELESLVRAALRAEEISETGLRQTQLRGRRREMRARAWGAVASVAVVAAVAVVLAVVTGTHSGGGNQPAGGSLAELLGSKWRVVSLTDSRGPLRVPASLHPTIGYTRDGYVLGDDTVNALQGRYQATADGYTVLDPASTAVGSTSMPPDRYRVVQAVDGLFMPMATRSDPNPPRITVSVSFEAGMLTLHAGSVSVTLRRLGAQQDFFAGAPSSTSTRTP